MKPKKKKLFVFFFSPTPTEICIEMSKIKLINSQFLGIYFDSIQRRLMEYSYLVVLFSSLK